MQKMVFQELDDSSRYVNDHIKLRKILSETGYLLMRDLIERKKVIQVRDDIMKILKKFEYVNGDVDEAKWTGKDYEKEVLQQVLTSNNCEVGKRVVRLKSLKNLVTSKELISLLERLLGGEVFVWKDNFERIRVMLPGGGKIKIADGIEMERATPAHQDGFIFRQKDGGDVPLYTAWTPIVDIDEKVGGLALLKNSHKKDSCEHKGHFYQHFFRRGEIRFTPVDKKQLQEWKDDGATVVEGKYLPTSNDEWMRSDYHPGDVLILHRHMLHRGIFNVSDRIRISGDLRYQRKGTPMEWQSQVTLAYNSKFRGDVRHHIQELGMNNQLGDKIEHLVVLQGPSRETGYTIPKRIKELAKILS